MRDSIVLTEIDPRGVATITLNRPEVNNAYNSFMIQELLSAVQELMQNELVRIIVLRGNGRHFQAGADLNWINEVSNLNSAENFTVSQDTTDAVRFLNQCPKPTIALVHGACFGGGTGIVAACDIVIASMDAIFSIAEVRWGLHAGPILPQLAAAIGTRNLRRFALTGERFDATQAWEIGLVHEVCEKNELDETVETIIDAILKNGPEAIADTKRIIFETEHLNVDDNKARDLAVDHARKRCTAEATEGLASFLEKREASWYPKV
ncbi:MAG: enoyl-CoA hydratase [Magnetovibrio sp.]|nr:enoyl-CoA hydratase [Magnetovibrio sp.]